MAKKLRGKAKAAFLRKMARGRAKARRKTSPRPHARRRSHGGGTVHRAKSRRNPSSGVRRYVRRKRRSKAQIAATRRMISARRKRTRATALALTHVSTGPRALGRKKKGSAMARKRRKRNPSRRRHTSRRRAPRRHRRRNRRTRTVTVRMSNPAIGGLITSGVTGLAAAGLVGLITTKFLGDKSMGIRALATVAIAALGAIGLRKRPVLADSFGSAAIGSLGYSFGVTAGGGVVATNKADAVAALQKMTAAPSAPPAQSGMGVLLPMNRGVRGMGVLTNSVNARSLVNGMGRPAPMASAKVLLG